MSIFDKYDESNRKLYIATLVQKGVDEETAKHYADQKLSQFQAFNLFQRGLISYENGHWYDTTGAEKVTEKIDEDLDKAAESLLKYIKDGGRSIKILGDYDTDGITGTAILQRMFDIVNEGRDENDKISVTTHIPSRVEGYGSGKILDTWKSGERSFLLTVDVGSNMLGQISDAISTGNIERAITLDHHQVENIEMLEKIDKDKIIHVNHTMTEIPHTQYSGAGTAYEFFKRVVGDKYKEDPFATSMAAVGTIADSVPLIRRNRDIAIKGLEIMRQNPEALGENFRSLIAKATEHSGLQNLNSSVIGYNLSPLLNAFQRMEESGDSEGAQQVLDYVMGNSTLTLKQIIDLNEKRQQITAETMQSVRQYLAGAGESALKSPVILLKDTEFLGGKTLSSSIAGLIASKVAEEYGAPTLVATTASNGTIKGSGRTTNDINLYKIFQEVKEKTNIEGGGHEGAIGFTINENTFGDLKTALNDLGDISRFRDTSKRTLAPIKIENKNFSRTVIEQMVQLNEMIDPAGEGMSEVLFQVEGLQLDSGTLSKDKKHLFFKGQTASGPIDIKFFNGGDFADKIPESADIVFGIMKDKNNQISLKVDNIKNLVGDGDTTTTKLSFEDPDIEREDREQFNPEVVKKPAQFKKISTEIYKNPDVADIVDKIYSSFTKNFKKPDIFKNYEEIRQKIAEDVRPSSALVSLMESISDLMSSEAFPKPNQEPEEQKKGKRKKKSKKQSEESAATERPITLQDVYDAFGNPDSFQDPDAKFFSFKDLRRRLVSYDKESPNPDVEKLRSLYQKKEELYGQQLEKLQAAIAKDLPHFKYSTLAIETRSEFTNGGYRTESITKEWKYNEMLRQLKDYPYTSTLQSSKMFFDAIDGMYKALGYEYWQGPRGKSYITQYKWLKSDGATNFVKENYKDLYEQIITADPNFSFAGIFETDNQEKWLSSRERVISRDRETLKLYDNGYDENSKESVAKQLRKARELQISQIKQQFPGESVEAMGLAFADQADRTEMTAIEDSFLYYLKQNKDNLSPEDYDEYVKSYISLLPDAEEYRQLTGKEYAVSPSTDISYIRENLRTEVEKRRDKLEDLYLPEEYKGSSINDITEYLKEVLTSEKHISKDLLERENRSDIQYLRYLFMLDADQPNFIDMISMTPAERKKIPKKGEKWSPDQVKRARDIRLNREAWGLVEDKDTGYRELINTVRYNNSIYREGIDALPTKDSLEKMTAEELTTLYSQGGSTASYIRNILGATPDNKYLRDYTKYNNLYYRNDKLSDMITNEFLNRGQDKLADFLEYKTAPTEKDFRIKHNIREEEKLTEEQNKDLEAEQKEVKQYNRDISIRREILGEYLVDENGEVIIDEQGNRIKPSEYQAQEGVKVYHKNPNFLRITEKKTSAEDEEVEEKGISKKYYRMKDLLSDDYEGNNLEDFKKIVDEELFSTTIDGATTTEQTIYGLIGKARGLDDFFNGGGDKDLGYARKIAYGGYKDKKLKDTRKIGGITFSKPILLELKANLEKSLESKKMTDITKRYLETIQSDDELDKLRDEVRILTALDLDRQDFTYYRNMNPKEFKDLQDKNLKSKPLEWMKAATERFYNDAIWGLPWQKETRESGKVFSILDGYRSVKINGKNEWFLEGRDEEALDQVISDLSNGIPQEDIEKIYEDNKISGNAFDNKIEKAQVLANDKRSKYKTSVLDRQLEETTERQISIAEQIIKEAEEKSSSILNEGIKIITKQRDKILDHMDIKDTPAPKSKRRSFKDFGPKFAQHMPPLLGFIGTAGAVTLFDAAFSKPKDDWEYYKQQRQQSGKQPLGYLW